MGQARKIGVDNIVRFVNRTACALSNPLMCVDRSGIKRVITLVIVGHEFIYGELYINGLVVFQGDQLCRPPPEENDGTA